MSFTLLVLVYSFERGVSSFIIQHHKSLSFYAFEMLYWCGIRKGKLPVLIPIVFDFKAKTDNRRG